MFDDVRRVCIIQSIWSGIQAMNGLKPRRVLCGLVVQQASLLIHSIALLLLSPRAKTTEHFAGFLLYGTGRTPLVSNALSPGGVEEKGCRCSDDPDGVAFRSDHKNEQLYRLSAAGPRNRALDNWNTAFSE